MILLSCFSICLLGKGQKREGMTNSYAEFLRKQKKGYSLTAASLPCSIADQHIGSFTKLIPSLQLYKCLRDLCPTPHVCRIACRGWSRGAGSHIVDRIACAGITVMISMVGRMTSHHFFLFWVNEIRYNGAAES